MASPTYSDILAYSSEVGKVSEAAAIEFAKLAKTVSFDDWSVAADKLRNLVMQVVDVYGLPASELGAQWYEYCRMLGIGGEYEASTIKPTRAKVVGDANRRIDRLFIGDITTDDLTFELGNVVQMQVKNVARDTVVGNMDIEYRNAIRRGDGKSTKKMTYARVPVGDTCAFCMLLASRGYVYGSEYAAGKRGSGNEFHDGCDCEVVPFSGPGSIKGYDYKQYEDKYLSARKLWSKNDRPDELTDRIDDAREEHEKRNVERAKKGLEPIKWTDLNEITITMRYQDPGLH